MLKIVKIKLINSHHNNLLAGNFGINKTQELITQKYYWSILRRNVEAYVIGCDICFALKVVKHKLYGDLQLLPVVIYQ